MLEDSVAKHMRADVTVGAFLSGGIDSTAIAALAMRHNPRLITFTTGFEREGFSEVDVAVASAEAIGARHVTKVVSQAEFVAALPEIVWYLDEPVADPALVPLFFIAREARKHVKVVLSGEGADELFGGYTIYREPLSLKPFDYLPRRLRKSLGKVSAPLPEGMRGKSLLHRGSLTLEERYYGNARSFSDAQLRAVLPGFRPEWTHTDVTAPMYAASEGWDPVARMQHIDLFTWLRGDILVKADKMTMANSLELRVPFLDPEVFAVASRLPLDQKITRATTKFALRRALEPIVPAHVLNRPKLGFPVPIRHWLRAGELLDWAYATIASSQAGELVDLAAVREMLDEHRSGASDHSRRLWTVLIFMLWHAIFVEHSVTPQISEPTYPVQLYGSASGGGDLLARLGAVGVGQPLHRDIAVPGPLLRTGRLQHQHGDHRRQLRRALQAQPGAAAGQEAGPERVADAGRIVLVGFGHHVDVDERAVGADHVDALGPQRRDPQPDLAHHLGLGPPGLLQQQVPFVVVGEQVGGAVDQLADLVAGQPGQLLRRVGGERQPQLAALLGVQEHRVGVVGADDHQFRCAGSRYDVGELDVAGLRHGARDRTTRSGPCPHRWCRRTARCRPSPRSARCRSPRRATSSHCR